MGFKHDNYPEHLPFKPTDLAAEQRHEWNLAKSSLVSRAVGAVALLGGKRQRSDGRITRTTPWLTTATLAGLSMEIRLRQTERTRDILCFPLGRRVSEVRVEQRITDTSNADPSEPYCTFFMKPENGMPAVVHVTDGRFPANRTHDPVHQEAPAWQELEGVIELFEQEAATGRAAS